MFDINIKFNFFYIIDGILKNSYYIRFICMIKYFFNIVFVNENK